MDNTTAKVSCFARAYHFENNKTHIFADNMAKRILGEDYDQIAQSVSQGIGFFLPGFEGTKEEGLRLIVDKQLSPSVLGRSAYCEEKLWGMIKNGCSQYLIFASGYDTFSIRNTDRSVNVSEEMTKRFFFEYNKKTPDHPMNAPSGVDYVFAIRAQGGRR